MSGGHATWPPPGPVRPCEQGGAAVRVDVAAASAPLSSICQCRFGRFFFIPWLGVPSLPGLFTNQGRRGLCATLHPRRPGHRLPAGPGCRQARHGQAGPARSLAPLKPPQKSAGSQLLLPFKRADIFGPSAICGGQADPPPVGSASPSCAATPSGRLDFI